ncbi:MAG: electron transfer flavoprotein subunit alpha/FixB family protein, partial [Acidimicrobiales bacterium]
MGVDTVWVVAEAGDSPVPVTLELLTQARSIGSTVAAVTWGTGTASQAAALGEHGATKVYDVGDLGGALPGPAVAAAIAALVQSGQGPDAILVPATDDGRD